jgi:hypothetical protein
MTTERLGRVYRRKAERIPSAAKAAIAAARPRDERGHFLPVVGDGGRLGGAVRPATLKGGGDTGSVDSVAQKGAGAV